MSKKFKTIEKNAKNAPVKDLEWEGEEIGVESTTKIEDDKGVGQEIILRSFDFAANPETFNTHKPTPQELFESHRRGMEAMLWTDGMAPYQAIEPRLMFSKDGTKYRFILSCIPSLGNSIIDKTKTLSQLLVNKTT